MRKSPASRGSAGLLPPPGLRLPGPGKKILVAVSGGLDSMVLLHVLKAQAATRRWKLSVAHFNHCLRGRDSDKDEAFVQRTAGGMKLPFFPGKADVREFAAGENLSIEMAARHLRHEFFARTARMHDINIVALAHHADDQVELFFLRLLRGAGGGGLGGMQWLSPSAADEQISLVRPLLEVPRSALQRYARQQGIRFREDATNLSIEFLRNRIRNELLPLLRRDYQRGLDKTILRCMEIAGAEARLIAKWAQAWLNEQAFEPGGERADGAQPPFVKAGFDDLPDAIQRQVLKLQITKLGITPDYGLIETLRNSTTKAVTVGANCALSRDRAGRVLPRRHGLPAFDFRSLTVKLTGPNSVVFDGVGMKWEFAKGQKCLRKPGKPAAGTEFFDADKIGGEIVLRHWRAGDRFQPIGLGRAVKLQDLFTNAKVPRARRHELTVAEAGNAIFWVEGLRMSENFKLTGQTKRVLVWNWRRRSFGGAGAL